MAHHHHHGHDHHHDHDHDHSHDPHHAAAQAAFADPAQESLTQALRAGFGVLRWLMVGLLAAYFVSGCFKIEPGEQGLIVRFGKLRPNTDARADSPGEFVFGPGTHVSLPDPFDQKIRIRSEKSEMRIETFCFQINEKSRNEPLATQAPQLDKLTPGIHGTMLTGDRNLSHGVWRISYRVANGEQFVRNIGDSLGRLEPILRRMAENAVVRSVAGMTVERVTRTNVSGGGGDFTDEVKRRLKESLDAIGAGVEIQDVSADTVLPGTVRQSFLNVGLAQNDSEKTKNEARQERARVLSAVAGPSEKHDAVLKAIDTYGAAQAAGADQARLLQLRAEIDATLQQAEGESAAMLRTAQSRANEIRQRVEREYQDFKQYGEAFRKAPRITIMRLWSQMREAVLNNPENEVFAVPASGEIEIISNRDPIRIKEREEAAAGKRMQ